MYLLAILLMTDSVENPASLVISSCAHSTLSIKVVVLSDRTTSHLGQGLFHDGLIVE